MIEETNFNLKEFNSYRVASICAKAFFPVTETDILNIYKRSSDKPKVILGNGNNVIFSKPFYEEEFIILNGCFNKISFNENTVSAESGATLQNLSEMALERSLSGFEMFYDIPSSVGGAVVMNAGSSGEEIKDLVYKVRYLDLTDMAIKEIPVEKMEFQYRNSYFQKNPEKIILKSWFKLESSDPVLISQKMVETKNRRWSKQPREYPNCGSVFKRPPGKFVGPMLDELGLKGCQIGGAQISKKHSGFIVNVGDATGRDILDLIKHVQRKVKDHFAVDLEVEQRIV